MNLITQTYDADKWQLVPREPPFRMVDEGMAALQETHDVGQWGECGGNSIDEAAACYKAMLAAAPQPETVPPWMPDDYTTPIPADEKRIDFLEAHPELQIRRHKKFWSVSTFSNYERTVFKTLRDAIDAERLKGEK